MKKTMRNGTFLRDSNGLADLLRLPFGYIIVAGIDEQIPVLTQEDARMCLGTLSATGMISFETAGRIQKQVEYAHLTSDITGLSKQVDKFRLPRDYQHGENFVMSNDGSHGHFKFRGLEPLESLVNPIDSFAFGIEMACDLVADGKAKPMEAVWALKQLRGSRLPITTEIIDGAQIDFGGFLTQIFGDDVLMELEDLFFSHVGNPTEPRHRPTTRPPEQETKATEPTVTVPPPEANNLEQASATQAS